MNWVNPADAMRAGIYDELRCGSCAHWCPDISAWCNKTKISPETRSSAGYYVCAEFKYVEVEREVQAPR